MNKKGFTLVELLGVIILLGLIGLIATVSVSNVLKENKFKLCNIQMDSIIESSKIYAADNILSLGDETIVTLTQLTNAGLFNEEIINPKTGEVITNLEVKITRVDNNLKYEIVNNPCN